MEIISGVWDFQLNRDTAVALGKFDGLHLGHQKLLKEILECKKDGLAACVFTFDPSPAKLFGLSDGKEISTKTEKRKLFEEAGVDILIEYPLNRELAAMTGEEFIHNVLVGQMHTRMIAAGEDVSFGYKGAGNAALLRSMAGRYGYEVTTIDKMRYEGVEISSTYVRERIEEGDMPAATALLGKPYSISGVITHGAMLGRDLGMPTINVVPEESKLLPPFGVYFARVFLKDKQYKGITNIGCKPTVTDVGQIVSETYLYDFDGDVYGEYAVVELLKRRRPEQKFAGLEALKKQLMEDLEAGRNF